MESAKFDHSAIENWWGLLKDLSVDLRIELAMRLLDSLKKDKEPTDEEKEAWKKLFGAWNDDGKTAEVLIAEIRSSRLSNRQIESLD